jgi:hypothetical protein
MRANRSMDSKIWPNKFISVNCKRMMLDELIEFGFVHDMVVKFPMKGRNLVITIYGL